MGTGWSHTWSLVSQNWLGVPLGLGPVHSRIADRFGAGDIALKNKGQSHGQIFMSTLKFYIQFVSENI